MTQFNIIGGRKVAQPTYYHQEYPKCGFTVNDGEVVGAVFADESEELAAAKLVSDLEAKAVEVGEPGKTELIEKLISAGVEVDKRWGAERLKAELAKLAG